MTRRTTAVLVSILVLTLALGGRVTAQLAVFDPVNYANAVLQLIQLQQQYTQLVLTYQQIRSQYEHMVRMARTVPVDMASRYRVPAVPSRITDSPDRYGTSGGWIAGLNYGDAIGAGYRRSTQALLDAGASWGRLPRDEVARIQGIYGTVELSDAAAIQAIHGIGMVRQNARQLQQALLNIESDTLTNRDDMNTVVGLLNKLGAVQVLAARGDQVTNQLLVSLLEERLVAGKRQRDIEAQTLNSHVIFERQARDLYRNSSQGTAQAIASFRLP
jgi:hypothetical protein